MNDNFFEQYPVKINIQDLENFHHSDFSTNWNISDMKALLMGTTCKNLVEMGFDDISFIDKWPGDTKIWVEIRAVDKFGTVIYTTVKFEILEPGNHPKPEWHKWFK